MKCVGKKPQPQRPQQASSQPNQTSSVLEPGLWRLLAVQDMLHLPKLGEVFPGLGFWRQNAWHIIALRDDAEKEAEDRALKSDMAQLEKDIKNSVRDLLRAARGHADVMCGLRAELGMQVGESDSMLIIGLEKFHSQVVEQLLTSPDDELLHILYKQVYSIFSHNLEKIATEGVVVATDMMEIDAEISQGNDTINQLQRSLTGNRQEPDAPLLAEKLSQSHVKSSKIRHTSIQQEIAQLNSQLNSLILKNREVEREIQEKNEKVETEIEYLLQTFDNEMEETQSNLELKGMDYEREEELRKLEKPFSVLEVECNQIQEKRCKLF
ncbi:dynein regulatory complex protein 10-like [Cyclopterus lumpus]|uniref:dynein regulatory complex protein 10-like n=1 Tax=Cyclopterus lumpus TaxID=8103 RepID=UPI0014867856|nr:dynein regulatory complex protein 10-like [Cyclopterus lumpus]